MLRPPSRNPLAEPAGTARRVTCPVRALRFRRPWADLGRADQRAVRCHPASHLLGPHCRYCDPGCFSGASFLSSAFAQQTRRACKHDALGHIPVCIARLGYKIRGPLPTVIAVARGRTWSGRPDTTSRLLRVRIRLISRTRGPAVTIAWVVLAVAAGAIDEPSSPLTAQGWGSGGGWLRRSQNRPAVCTASLNSLNTTGWRMDPLAPRS